MAGVGVGGDEVACARGCLQGGPGDVGRLEHGCVGAGGSPAGLSGRLAQVGLQGGRKTLRRYGPGWFSLLARRRWGRIGPEELEAARVIQ
jgi:hypothetical protein